MPRSPLQEPGAMQEVALALEWQGDRPPHADRTVAARNLLDMLSAADRGRLLEMGRSRKFEAGDEVVRQGSPGDCLFVVEDGELAVVRSLPGDEQETHMTARPGALLGEVAALDGGVRTASMRALRPTVLRVIELGAFDALTLHGGEIGHRILCAVAASMHERVDARRRAAAEAGTASPATTAEGETIDWSEAGPQLARVMRALPAFAKFALADCEAMLPALRTATLPPGAALVLPEAIDPGVVLVLRGALSAWLHDRRGPERVMPAVGPGGFVDYAAVLGFAADARRWRTRSPTQLLRLDRVLFGAESESSARLLYALSRDLAATLRRTTNLALHFGMSWRMKASPERATTAVDSGPPAA